MKRAPASPVLRDFARGLGWFSIALGLGEALAPRTLSRTIGLRGNGTLIRLFGLREIATGIGILTAKDPAPWIMGRIGGDTLDIAAMAAGFIFTRRPRSLQAALTMVLAVTALDVLCGNALNEGRFVARLPRFDYGDRSGFPQTVEKMKGIARAQPAST